MLNKILIVDDDVAILAMLEEVFKDRGYEVQVCNYTKDIIGLIKESKPDLIILDYLIGGMNGGEMCAQIKKDIHTKHLPVVLITAYEKVIQSLGSYGCNVLVSKPFDNETLLEQIQHLSSV